jgi:predicted nucleotidyltransferase
MADEAETRTLKCRNDKVLTRFRAAVAQIYGDRVERIVLFGSRARGEAKPDSDYDIAVFIKNAGSFAEESARLAAVTTDILLDMDAVISATPFPAGAYRERTGFMHELRKDGLDL